MMRTQIFLLGLGMSLACASGVAGAAPSPSGAPVPAPAALELALRAHVQLDHPRIVLGDLAELPADATAALAGLDIGPAPRVQQIERFSRAQLAVLIRARYHQPLPPLAWSGADSVQLQTVAQAVPGSALATAAIDGVNAALGARHPGLQASVLAEPAAVDMPAGAYQMVVRPLDAAAVPSRLAVWLDLVANGQVYRSVVVPVTLSLVRPAYVARRQLSAGALAVPEDFDVRDIDVAGLDARPVGADTGGWRVRHTLQSGQVLAQGALAVAGTVYPGDRIRMLVNSGAIGIEAAAVVQAQAVPGQLVAVRSSISSDTVTGRLTAAGTVIIE